MRLGPWTHWHTKGVLTMALGLNVWSAFTYGTTYSWVMAGACIGALITDTICWRLWVMNRSLVKTIEEQNAFIVKLGSAKMDETAERIARHISEITGHDVEMIRVSNESLKKDKLH